jgi:hypothetical protein
MATVQHWSGRNYEVRTDPIEVSSYSPRPDPDWTDTDSHGHTHTRTSNTWRWVVTDVYWCSDCRDEHEDGEYRCNACGERVIPGTLPASPFPEFIAGPRHYLIDGQEVTEQEFRTAYETDHGKPPSS